MNIRYGVHKYNIGNAKMVISNATFHHNPLQHKQSTIRWWRFDQVVLVKEWKSRFKKSIRYMCKRGGKWERERERVRNSRMWERGRIKKVREWDADKKKWWERLRHI